MKQPQDAALIGVVIYDGVETIDVGGTAGVVSMASRVLPGIASTIIAARKGPVRLAGGVTVTADDDFETAPCCDVFIICGGPGWRQQVGDQAMMAFLRSRPLGAVASVCTGALILAQPASSTAAKRPLGETR